MWGVSLDYMTVELNSWRTTACVILMHIQLVKLMFRFSPRLHHSNDQTHHHTTAATFYFLPCFLPRNWHLFPTPLPIVGLQLEQHHQTHPCQNMCPCIREKEGLNTVAFACFFRKEIKSTVSCGHWWVKTVAEFWSDLGLSSQFSQVSFLPETIPKLYFYSQGTSKSNKKSYATKHPYSNSEKLINT